ncbi:potassium transporter TrkG [Mycoplasma sp. 744]|uniref:TrkH family potassium uptake protein n=1 Tax=Mycoplasma sp. 744 TaxID=3108531 RepID=UPI002B1DFB0C|nr:potassium transporter TrkG [Mycoplasma sp. 744]MEA4115497.1 potassium transporter TrkG [Mycoplasma sp. 744]
MRNWKLIRWYRHNSLYRFFSNLNFHFKKTKKIRIIFFTYLLIVLLSSLLLFSPLTHQEINSQWNSIKFEDALFTASSAFSDTGLVTLSTFKTWNIFGQSIIAILIFLGGIGVFVLKIYIFNFLFFGKLRFSLSEINLASAERTDAKGQSSKQVIVDAVTFLIIIFLVSSIGLSFYFYLVPARNLGEIETIYQNNLNLNISQSKTYQELGEFILPHNNWALSFRYGFFHALSALNNAGFDIIGEKSLLSFYHNIELQIFFVILFLIGGLGYPIIHDIFNFFRFKSKHPKRKYYWQLLTKISTITYLLITIIAFLIILCMELLSKNHILQNQNDFYNSTALKIWALFFTSLSTRSAGFATIPINQFSPNSILILIILMFIGAGPSSTGGGIRTTTFAIISIALISRLTGRPSVRAFKRKIGNKTVRNSFTVFLTSIMLVLFASIILSTSSSNYFGQADYDFLNYIFEATSAFGTSGLTVGISEKLNIFSKIILTLIMFIGQFGVSSTLLVWGRKRNYSYKYEYITEDIAIG